MTVSLTFNIDSFMEVLERDFARVAADVEAGVLTEAQAMVTATILTKLAHEDAWS